MMTNLFSVFDPSSSMFSLAWMLIFFMVWVFPKQMWKSMNPLLMMKKKISNTFYKEVLFTLKNSNKSQELIILLVFFTILSVNVVALYPQVFSISSHLIITLPLSLISWLSIVIFGWTKNTLSMLIHLVPQGTPSVLMMFMVMIELTSNVIRPITLCVRLTANLIAGHLLMTLLGNSLMAISTNFLSLALIAPMILTVLESAVACIQAYVFMTLVTLYITEIK